MWVEGFVDASHVKRERVKARELRNSVWWRQKLGKGICYHCEKQFPMDQLTMDHRIPLARGGKTTKKNVVVSCHDCNVEKSYLTRAELTLKKMKESGELPG